MAELVAALERAAAVLVLDEGQPLGVLTSQDVLGFLAESGS
jgi:predicted transcriptional regulator